MTCKHGKTVPHLVEGLPPPWDDCDGKPEGDQVLGLVRAHIKEMRRNAMRYTKERAGFEDALRELESRL